ncbi:hypothetical protein D7Z96_04910 [Pseudarthrobacter phenanthrenivorans]|uniref:Uncharacterized protein n=2 Tax=Pseudarthrobacter phenanthrenivorans TaxID=361575 RepID=A0A3B0FWX4_PSEPS|nr:hypothetical protein [Pseudarthrobacter phenanthrenivorans]ADX72163.1 hypothetical protein Asphe3_09740 [Pseudarthrobacter phenanthrenivorans Sphe3]RKO26092.1 hypothetical protein D7Z96_04910 [Pseudarthrobacter phenanthrenivorans]TPV49417.1 hypothetical protein FJ661_15865 [Pseudarthrobacter phenanthrenivorans]
MTGPYTRGDSFSSEASRKNIKRALADYGATDVLFTQRGHRHAVAFRSGGRQFRIVMSMLQSDGPLAIQGDKAESARQEANAKVLERANRKSWHALALAIEAKLGAAAAGIATLESEFLAHVVLPGNRTVLDELEPVIDAAYRSGQRPSFGDPAASSSPAETTAAAD